MPATTEQLVRLLLAAVSDPFRCAKAVADFQSLVWAGLDTDVPPGVAGVLRDLAYDLDYFEPSARARGEDESFYSRSIAFFRAAVASAIFFS